LIRSDILPRKAGALFVSLSVITANMPSKKKQKICWNPLSDSNRAGSLIRNPFRGKLVTSRDEPARVRLHPKFTSHRAK
jgi:hypothetical protein